MQSNNKDHQSAETYDLYVPDYLEFDKSRRDSKNKCLHNYDPNAFTNFFLGPSRQLPPNAVNEVLHAMVEHKNQSATFMSTYKTPKSIRAISSSKTYHKSHFEGFPYWSNKCEIGISFDFSNKDPCKILQSQVRLTPGDCFITKDGSAPFYFHPPNAKVWREPVLLLSRRCQKVY